MKTFLKLFQMFLLMCGVFAAEKDEVKSVMEGDSVTLNPDLTNIQEVYEMLWMFGDAGQVIAQIDEKKTTSYPSHTEIFRGKLQLNQTGFLTIRNMRIKHSGPYKLEINHDAGTKKKEFSVTVYENPSVIGGGDAEMKIMSVKKGDSVTLNVPQLQGNELIVWRFGDEGRLIAKHDKEAKSSPLFDPEERFRDGLKLDQTGSLNITDTRTTDSGLYTVKISSNKQTSYKRFTVSVTALPDPGYSGGAVAGIVVGVLLVCVAVAAVAAAVYFLRPRIIDLPSETWSVTPGDTVTLNPDTEIKTGDEIQWRRGETLIAQIKGKNRGVTTYEGPGQIFTNKLKLDSTTGSLTITDTTAEQAGLYTLTIRRGRETLYKRFMVSAEMKRIYVVEGEDYTITPKTEIQKGDEIEWQFEDFEDEKKQTLIAEIKDTGATKYEDTDERFKDRLKLDVETTSLTIRKFTSEQAGYYTLKIRRVRETIYEKFSICDDARTIEVMEGEDVNLNPVTDIKEDDLIKWQYRNGQELAIIAEIRGEPRGPITHDDVLGGRFKDRLKLETNRSLTIMNTRSAHTGCYELISSGGESYQTFSVTVTDKVELKLLNAGDDVTLKPDKEIQRDDQILWMFKDKLIAQIKGGSEETYDGPGGRFRDKLKLEKTGSLTITNIRTEHDGLYNLQIISSGEYLFKKYRVSVRWKLPERKESGIAVTDEERKKSVKENNDSRGKRENESVTVVMPLLNGEDEGEYVNVNEMNEDGDEFTLRTSP